MKKILGIMVIGFFLTIFKAYSHSGNTGPTGCHMDYSTAQYHCHKKKQPNPLGAYYYIKHQGHTYGPYASYYTCMSAIRGAGVYGAFCSTAKY